MAPTTDPNSPVTRYIVTGVDRCEPGYFTQRDAGSHDYLLIYTVRGGGLFTHADGTFASQAHDVVLIEPRYYHRYEVHPQAKTWERLWAHFVSPPTWTIWLKWPQVAPGYHKLTLRDRRTRQRVTGRLREAHRIMCSYLAHREPLALNALEAALLWCDERNPEADRARLDPRVRDALDYICHYLDTTVNIQTLAQHCKLSPSRLAHLFREQVGSTPQQFLEHQRVMRARQLLELTGMSVAEVSYAVGYDNPFYFSLRFKKAVGLSPRQYRESVRR